jgi:hypothetical protein
MASQKLTDLTSASLENIRNGLLYIVANPESTAESKSVLTQTLINEFLNSVETTILSTDWSTNEAELTISGITSGSVIWVSPTPASYDDFVNNKVQAVSQDLNTLVFNCETEPTTDIDLNVAIGNF